MAQVVEYLPRDMQIKTKKKKKSLLQHIRMTTSKRTDKNWSDVETQNFHTWENSYSVTSNVKHKFPTGPSNLPGSQRTLVFAPWGWR
jgi:hypothetical protein